MVKPSQYILIDIQNCERAIAANQKKIDHLEKRDRFLHKKMANLHEKLSIELTRNPALSNP